MVIGMHTHTHTDDLGGPSYRTAAGVPTKGLPHDSRKASLGLHAKMVLTSPSLPPHTHPLTSSTNPPHPSDPTLSPPPPPTLSPPPPPTLSPPPPPTFSLPPPPLRTPPSHLHHPSTPHLLTSSTTPPHTLTSVENTRASGLSSLPHDSSKASLGLHAKNAIPSFCPFSTCSFFRWSAWHGRTHELVLMTVPAS